jgi:hypothetical protein
VTVGGVVATWHGRRVAVRMPLVLATMQLVGFGFLTSPRDVASLTQTFSSAEACRGLGDPGPTT